MSLLDWEITKPGVYYNGVPRLTHDHGVGVGVWFCCKDNQGWFCRRCKKRPPIEMVWVAKLVGAVPCNEHGN